MFVFGSAAREEDYVDGESDIDLLVNFTPAFDSVASDAYFELIDGLEEILGVTVDILSERQLKNPYLIEAIHKDRVTLYAA